MFKVNESVTHNGIQGVVLSLTASADTAMVKFEGTGDKSKYKAIPVAELQAFVATPEIIENPQPVKNLPATIDVMAEVTITSAKLDYDKQHWLKVIDNMSIEDINSAFLKKLNQDRIDLMKQVNAEAEILNQDLKDVYAHAERRIAHLKAEAEKAEKLRREDKHAEVTILLSDLKAKSNLPQKYLDKIELKESYLQVTFKGKKLTEDIQAQFDLQERLFKADEDALALKAAKIKNREMLIEKLNLQYGSDSLHGFKFTYADFIVESFDDEYVEAEYARIAEAKRHEEELKRQREEKKAEAIATEKEFLDTLPSAPAVKKSSPVEQVVSKTEITEPSGNSEQLPTDLPEYDLPEDLPAYDLPENEPMIYKSFQFGFTTSFQALSLDNAITKLKQLGILVKERQ